MKAFFRRITEDVGLDMSSMPCFPSSHPNFVIFLARQCLNQRPGKAAKKKMKSIRPITMIRKSHCETAGPAETCRRETPKFGSCGWKECVRRKIRGNDQKRLRITFQLPSLSS